MKPLVCNVGSTDKKIRIVAGLIISITLFALKSWWWLGGVAIMISGLLDLCPIYLILGISTCREPQKWWK